MLIAAGLSMVLPLMLATQPVPPSCSVTDSLGRCLVTAVDPGRPGGPAEPTGGSAPSPRQAEPSADAAPSAPAQIVPNRPRLEALPLGDGGWVQGEQPDIDALLAGPAANAAQPAPGAVPADVIAQRAVQMLTLPPPVVHMSATGPAYVGVPLWLWTDDDAADTGPISATATAGAAQVTATGRLTTVEWSMVPSGEIVRCIGTGTPWTGQDGPSPDCGYTYDRRSLPERTHGTGLWTVTVTGVWTVTWAGTSAGAPVNGQQTVRLSSDADLAVGEIQVLSGGIR